MKSSTLRELAAHFLCQSLLIVEFIPERLRSSLELNMEAGFSLSTQQPAARGGGVKRAGAADCLTSCVLTSLAACWFRGGNPNGSSKSQLSRNSAGRAGHSTAPHYLTISFVLAGPLRYKHPVWRGSGRKRKRKREREEREKCQWKLSLNEQDRVGY